MTTEHLTRPQGLRPIGNSGTTLPLVSTDFMSSMHESSPSGSPVSMSTAPLVYEANPRAEHLAWTFTPLGFNIPWLLAVTPSEASALSNTLDLERNSLTFDPTAMALLGRIQDRGHATCEDLSQWLETSAEWIAFSRLQRSRLLNDSGTEFTVSRDGRRLVEQMLSEID